MPVCLLRPWFFLAVRSGCSCLTAALSLSLLLCEMGTIRVGGEAPAVVGFGQAGALLLPIGQRAHLGKLLNVWEPHFPLL